MATVEDILLPDIGDFAQVEVIEILVKPGDRIELEQSLLTLESDKATIEIPSPKAGIVQTIKIHVGDRVSQGDPLLSIELGNAEGAAAPLETPAAPLPESLPAQRVASPSAPPPTDEAGPSKESGKAQVEILSVVLPDIGDFSEIPVIEVLVAPGERVTREQSLLTLESDKATMEIPSPFDGIVEEIAVKVGDILSQGDLILTLRTEQTPASEDESGKWTSRHPGAQTEVPGTSTPIRGEETPASAAHAIQAGEATPRRAPGDAERRPAPVLPRPEDMTAIAKGRKAHASPAIRRFARELGVDLGLVKGSGPKGRVLKEDVQGFIKQTLAGGAPTPAASLPFALPPAAEVDFAKFGAITFSDLSRIKKISGRHLHRAWLSIPHVTQFDEADITELENFRTQQKQASADSGVKLTFLPFLLKAVAAALERMPIIKSSLSADGERLVFKHYTHIGVAVDTPQGLVVPVLRDVNGKGVHALAAELADLSAKARAGKLLPGDMQGGCFSISSLGGIGGTAFTPIVNAPEVAILGISRAQIKPVWNGQTFEPRLMLPLALSYDHRVIDGADGARFTALLGELLADIRRLVL